MEQAVAELERQFGGMLAELDSISQRVNSEFASRYQHGELNPLKILQRIKGIQQELPALREECQRTVAAKQDLLEFCAATLYKTQRQLEQTEEALAASTLPIEPYADHTMGLVHQNFSQMLELWRMQATVFGIDFDLPQRGTALNNAEDLNFEILQSAPLLRPPPQELYTTGG